MGNGNIKVVGRIKEDWIKVVPILIYRIKVEIGLVSIIIVKNAKTIIRQRLALKNF